MRAALERGDPIPASFLDRPEVWSYNKPAWDCFYQLSRSRALVSTGMSALYGHLAYQDISTWAHDHGEADTPDDLDEFVFLVQRMDTEWLKLNQPKASTARGK